MQATEQLLDQRLADDHIDEVDASRAGDIVAPGDAHERSHGVRLVRQEVRRATRSARAQARRPRDARSLSSNRLLRLCTSSTHRIARQIVELTVLIGTYNMNARVLQALELDLEPAAS